MELNLKEGADYRIGGQQVMIKLIERGAGKRLKRRYFLYIDNVGCPIFFVKAESVDSAIITFAYRGDEKQAKIAPSPLLMEDVS